MINSVPLRRINQSYVIATKTKLDLSSVKLPERLNDVYFIRMKLKKPRGMEGEMFESEKKAYYVTDERKEDQKAVDGQLMALIKKEDYLKGYLQMAFSLSNKQRPHKMVF